VGIIIDGLPETYIIPATFNQLLQAPDDYSQNYIAGSTTRFLRHFLALISLALPGFYVSVTSFHHEMIPTELALSIVAAKEGVPFPAFIEIVIMLLAFEALIEASLRLPQNIGQAVSILGTLIVGQAAVEAKFVSPAVVIIIAVSGISTFGIPSSDLANAFRMWRFILVVASTIAGLFGLTMGVLYLLYQLCSLESYGVPFLSPYVTSDAKSMKDTLFRFPQRFYKERPEELKVTNKRRQK
jgi:hypothetical protein